MKKEIILEAAARLFAKNGYARTSTVTLAHEAGVAEGTIFRHFKSKEELFIALILRLNEKLLQDVYQYLEMQDHENGIDYINSTIKAVYLFMRKNGADFALLLRDAPGCYGEDSSKAFEHVKSLFTLMQEHFENAIVRGQEEGSIRPELHSGDTACLLASSLVGLMRTVHLGFLQPSEHMLKHYLLCNRAMLEVR